jgi:chemotaxis protein MotA
MVVIIGFIVVIASVLGGFTIAGGHVEALIHPSELLTIGGAALGAAIVMAPFSVLQDLMKALLQCFTGSPYGKDAYTQLFQCTYEFFRIARREGLLALEKHIRHSHDSTIFSKYPAVSGNHHVLEFYCGLLGPVIDGTVSPDAIDGIAETELKGIAEEHHGPISVLTKTADALPGFGIVAAVLGIVIVMGGIDGPVHEIGHKVGAALVGTFLGILLSYGFFAPLAVKLEFLAEAETSYFRSIVTLLRGLAKSENPRITIEMARRGMGKDIRPSEEELATLLAAAEA